MSNPQVPTAGSGEKATGALPGAMMLLLALVVFFAGIALFIRGAVTEDGLLVLAGAPLALAAAIAMFGLFTLQTNEARLLILFGSYRGTVRRSGFFWANPFYARARGHVPLNAAEMARKTAAKAANTPTSAYRALGTKISLRARNFNSEKLKVNDKRGNPVEIAAVIVWRVEDTAKAAFDVDDFESYVQIQSESALRHIASLYSYDRAEDESAESTLRDSAEEVAVALQGELRERLAKAGVAVDEARLTHLAYAPEIAQAMLRRQQAEAVIAARTKIVFGAVSMVDMALRELSAKGVVVMDEERKAAMVSNLLVVLCGETEVTPIVNTGTLYP